VPLTALGLTPCALQGVAMEKYPEHRWLAKIAAGDASKMTPGPESIHIYAPMTAQLTSGDNAPPRPSR
jgi:hypothetical protein